jgi:hypothetical protein
MELELVVYTLSQLRKNLFCSFHFLLASAKSILRAHWDSVLPSDFDARRTSSLFSSETMSILTRNLSFVLDWLLVGTEGGEVRGSEKSNRAGSFTIERGTAWFFAARRGAFAIGGVLRGFWGFGGETGGVGVIRQTANGSAVLLFMLLRVRFACNAFHGSVISDIVKPRKTE